MTETNEEVVVAPEANETSEVETIAVPKADFEKLHQTVGSLKRELKDFKKASEPKAATEVVEPKTPTGGLDEMALDYLDLKGVTDSEDIDFVENVVQKTGMSVRQALKDDVVIAKLTANKAARDLKEATPSATKRSGSSAGGNDFAVALAEYKASGFTKLPDDFALKTAIINAVEAETNPNKPAWRT